MKTIGILYGGKSGEHEVSCQSAASISRHINPSKYRLVYIGILKDGTWHVQELLQYRHDPSRGELLEIAKNTNPVHLIPGRGIFLGNKSLEIDFILPILHGTYGEDGTLQGLLDMLEIPYAGAGVLASSLCMDKTLAKCIFRDAGIPVVDFLDIHKTAYTQNSDQIFQHIETTFSYPCFIKPVRTGSSVGVSKATDRSTLHSALETAFHYDSRILVEKAINAREIECAVLGNENPEVFEPGEIIPHHDFYSYDAKYLDPNGARLCIPADIPPALSEKIRETAKAAYQAATLSGFSRVDIFIDRDTGEIYLNEINTIPGFTHISMFPRMCEAGGVSYTALIDRIIELGLMRYASEHDTISYSLDSESV